MKKIQFLIILSVIMLICSCGKKEIKLITQPGEIKSLNPLADDIIVKDDFEKYDVGVWSSGVENTWNPPAPWKISMEENNTYWSIVEESGNKFVQQTRTEGGAHILFLPDQILGDMDISMKVRLEEYTPTDFTAAFMLRYEEGGQGYICGLASSGDVIAWRQGQDFGQIKAVENDYETGKWYLLRAVLKGDKIELYIDGQLKVSTTDSKYKKGSIGFFTYASSASFDDFTVKGQAKAVKDGGNIF